METIKTVAILSTGLLGASLAKALKKRGVVEKVFAWSRGESTRAKCRALPSVFDSVFDSPSEAVADADLVVVCSPTSNIPEIVSSIKGSLKNGAIVTDVGSVKKVICDACSVILKDSNAIFIGSHPMAGSEKIGIDYSDSELFEARPCFITPDSNVDKFNAEKLAKLWQSVGMRTYIVSPSEHDCIVANVSHLPHIVAGTLCNVAADFKNGDLRDYSGPGFRDSTRISSGNPEIWDSIISDNRDEIVKALKSFAKKFSEIIDAVENKDSEKVGIFLRNAKSYRDKL